MNAWCLHNTNSFESLSMAEEDELNALSDELERIKENLRTNTIQIRQMVEELKGVLPLMNNPGNLGEKIQEIGLRLVEPQGVRRNASDTNIQGLLPNTLQESKEQDPIERFDGQRDDGSLPFSLSHTHQLSSVVDNIATRRCHAATYGRPKMVDLASIPDDKPAELVTACYDAKNLVLGSVKSMTQQDEETVELGNNSNILVCLEKDLRRGRAIAVAQRLQEHNDADKKPFLRKSINEVIAWISAQQGNFCSLQPFVYSNQFLKEWEQLLTLENMRGKIILLAQNRVWNGILNLKLERRLSEQEMILLEVMDFLGELMRNQFGSFFVHKLFVVCNDDQRTRIIVALTKFPLELLHESLFDFMKDDPLSILGRFWVVLCLQLMAAATRKETIQASLVGVLRARLKQGEGNVASGLSLFDEKGGESLNSNQGASLNSDGVSNDMALQIDKDPHSRHFIIHGGENSQRLFASNILISGMQYLEAEITKNLICVGTESVALYDVITKELWDLSIRFVGSKGELEESGALTSAQRMQGLNISVIMSVLTSELAKEQFSDFEGVPSTNIILETIIESDDYPYQYQPPLAFIKYESMGLCGSAWRLYQLKYIRLKRTIWEIYELDCILGSLSCCFRAKKWPQEPLPPPEPPPPPSLGKKRTAERRELEEHSTHTTNIFISYSFDP